MNAPATTGRPSATLTGSAGRRRDAGPFRTRALALRSNSEKWHGHLTVLDAGCQSHASHPVCVQTAEYATMPSTARALVSRSSARGSRWTSRIWFRRLRSEEHTSELQSRPHLVCRLLLEKKNYAVSSPRVTYDNHQLSVSESLSGARPVYR